jgi:hypothetical protein
MAVGAVEQIASIRDTETVRCKGGVKVGAIAAIPARIVGVPVEWIIEGVTSFSVIDLK